MSMFYYMAASRELPTGVFGTKKTVMKLGDYLTHVNPAARGQFPIRALLDKYPEDEQLIDIYETEEDAAGLYVGGLMSGQDTSHLFRHPLVYPIAPQGGSFSMNIEMKERYPNVYTTGKKCLAELFGYLNRHMNAGEELELFSCWADGLERFLQPRNKGLDLMIELSEFRFEERAEFEWKDQQYIVVRK